MTVAMADTLPLQAVIVSKPELSCAVKWPC